MEIKICQIFESIQGEGKFAGTPMLFIRTSGCNRNCKWCDTKYHKVGKNITIENLAKIIKKSKLNYVCFTGGEPLLWKKQLLELGRMELNKIYHIETNGDLIKPEDIGYGNAMISYIACSPKDKKTASRFKKLFLKANPERYDIKVVTDLRTEGKDMLKYATMLMPLTTYYFKNKENKKKDEQIKRDVWNYCIEHNIKYTSRSHIETWGYKQSGK
jgi:organic radical activating enzyme